MPVTLDPAAVQTTGTASVVGEAPINPAAGTVQLTGTASFTSIVFAITASGLVRGAGVAIVTGGTPVAGSGGHNNGFNRRWLGVAERRTARR